MAEEAVQQNAYFVESLNAQNATLGDIYILLQQISQSAASSGSVNSIRTEGFTRKASDGEDPSAKWKPRRERDDKKHYTGSITDQIGQGFQEALKDALNLDDFTNKISKSVSNFADELGVDVNDLVGDLSKRAGKEMIGKFKNTEIGKDIFGNIDKVKSGLADGISDFFNKGAANLQGGMAEGAEAMSGAMAEGAGTIAESSGTVVAASQGVEAAGMSAGTASAGFAAAGEGLAALGPYALIAVAAIIVIMKVIDELKEALGPAIDGIKAMEEATQNAAHRTQVSAKANIKNAQDRLKADIESMLKAPFTILQESAEKVEAAWDSSLNKIASTQGYTKADVQDLMSSFAQRLRQEGLTSVVSAANITENLTRVLDAGLSGVAAEEFAYLATKLNAAIPTEDFFSYAESYASIAATAIQSGASQSEAIAQANSQLEQFANNVLYASRQIAGGFSTGLKDASGLLSDAVKIANAAGTGNSTEISGVLTSVSAIVGAVAPDLASDIVSNIVDAAIGGNSDTATALRSLANTGASNTAFLKAMASDPQSVFSKLFTNLAKLQTMSSDNFMEVAEGLSEVFGISMDAFARVDFKYLADAISAMNTSSNSLEQNLALLASGETTTTAEQLRMQQVNEYLLEEGLSYVLDNEVARSVQEHMWDEQLAREMQEATYAVDMQGAALELLQGIESTVENIINFINPFSWMKKLGNVIQTATESAALSADLLQVLVLGNVGAQNAATLYDLTTTNRDLKLTSSYATLLGGASLYDGAKLLGDVWQTLSGQGASTGNTYQGIGGVVKAAGDVAHQLGTIGSTLNQAKVATFGVSSQYAWSTVGKSVSSYLAKTKSSADDNKYTQALTATEQIAAASNAKFTDFLQSMDKYIEKGKTYEQWAATASKYGIKDLEQAMEDYGTNEIDLRSAFTAKEAQQASVYDHERDLVEDLFWETGTHFWAVVHPEFEKLTLDRLDELINLSTLQLNELIKSNAQLTEFYNQWIEYYVKHTAYTQETLNAYNVAGIRNAEKDETGDAVLALANALTSNAVDLKDPAVQTNVLLSQMLLVLEAIMQQNNDATKVSLPNALSALGLGIS